MLDRERLIERLASNALDGADMKSLEQFFYDEQVRFLNGLTDNELVEHAYNYIDDFDDSVYYEPVQERT